MEPIFTSPQLQAAYLAGVNDANLNYLWRGALGMTLIIFGVIGWPMTRYFLGVVAYPFTRRPPRKPIGSKFWDKYSSPHMQSGFDYHQVNSGGGKK